MKKLRIINLLLALSLFAFIFACKKDNNEGSSNGGPVSGSSLFNDKYDVYMAGHEETEEMGVQAIYWKNDSKVQLNTEGMLSSAAKSIFVDGEDVYVGGNSYVGNKTRVTYWKNGVSKFLSDDETFVDKVTAMAVENGKVYITGYFRVNDKYVLAYWTDDKMVILGDSSIDTWTTSIFVENGDVYVCGWEQKNSFSSRLTAVYWKNGNRVQLAHSNDHSKANDIFVKNGDVYVVGTYENVGGEERERGTIWKNDSIVLRVPGTLKLDKVFVEGNDIYTLDKNNQFYWKNLVKVDLHKSSNALIAEPRSIFVVDGEVFVAGTENMSTSYTNNNHMAAKLWKNGNGMQLSDGKNSSTYLQSIYVVKK